jgi:hypothetical protein
MAATGNGSYIVSTMHIQPGVVYNRISHPPHMKRNKMENGIGGTDRQISESIDRLIDLYT